MNQIERVDRAATKLDRAIIAMVERVARPVARWRQVVHVMASHFDAERGRLADRQAESRKAAALRRLASELVIQIDYLLDRANREADTYRASAAPFDTVHLWVAELRRWRRALLRVMGSDDITSDGVALNIADGDRALTERTLLLARNRGLRRLETTMLLIAMQSRMALTRVRRLREDISTESYILGMQEARANMRTCTAGSRRLNKRSESRTDSAFDSRDVAA